LRGLHSCTDANIEQCTELFAVRIFAKVAALTARSNQWETRRHAPVATRQVSPLQGCELCDPASPRASGKLRHAVRHV